jgi:hypothetical protein
MHLPLVIVRRCHGGITLKTVSQKAMEVAEKIDQCSCLAAIHGLIIMALKEQDRDTRHACSEAVGKLHTLNDAEDSLLRAATRECMNVQAL